MQTQGPTPDRLVEVSGVGVQDQGFNEFCRCCSCTCNLETHILWQGDEGLNCLEEQKSFGGSGSREGAGDKKAWFRRKWI